MPTAAPDETASAFDRDAHRVLRYGAPCFALLMSIEALSHLITGSSGTDPRVLVPGLSAPIVAAVGLAAWRSEAAGPHPLDAWLLVPWALSLSSIGIHLPAQPVLCLIFASMAALTCAALYLSRRALAVSLPITLIVQIGSAWLSIPELGRGVLLVPVFTLPIALMTHLARRRALLAAEHRRRLELEVQSQKARIERLEQERERLRLEAEMRRQADELDESRRIVRAQGRLASIGSHAAGMVHQISNPVGAILTSADFAILVGDERDGEQIRKESLEHIRAHAERCRRIVRGLLTFSRAHDGERERVDLTVLIERAAAATAHYAKARGARVELSLDGVPGGWPVRARAIGIEEVFVNLLCNAIESRSEDTRVRVAARSEPQHVSVFVEDDGAGVAPADADRIFEPFFTTRIASGGTGLGLAVARDIVREHGGEISLELPPGPEDAGRRLPGACFRVRLPLDDVDPDAGVPQAGSSARP